MKVILSLLLLVVSAVSLAQDRTQPVTVGSRDTSPITITRGLEDARRALRQPNLTPKSAASTLAARSATGWIGECRYQDMPYLGVYSDGVSQAWGGYFSQPHAGTCHSDSGTYYDFWLVPAEPGDVFDVAFAGAYNSYLALAKYDPAGDAYEDQLAVIPGTGSLAGKYIGGWLDFTVPASWTTGYIEVWVAKDTSQVQYLVGAVKAPRAQTATCTPTSQSMCLSNGRYEVRAHWRKPDGTSGEGTAVSLTGETGYFWFFNSANVETVVKVLNACAVNGHTWVFAGGLTNVEVTLSVLDTQFRGASRDYLNPLGTPFQPIQDTSAFPCQ